MRVSGRKTVSTLLPEGKRAASCQAARWNNSRRQLVVTLIAGPSPASGPAISPDGASNDRGAVLVCPDAFSVGIGPERCVVLMRG
jgi:hypothetical protein